MAGEQNLDILDMSLFDTSGLEQTETEVIEDNNTVVDDVSQEIVDNPKDEKDLAVEEKTTNSPADSDEVFNQLAAFLKEEGFFSTLDKEVKTAEDLAEAFKAEIKKNEFAGLNEAQKDYLKALENGIPDDVFNNHLQTTSILDGITDEVLENDENVRRNLIIQEALNRGNSREKAERIYKRSYEIGDSITDAKDAKEYLQTKEAEQYEYNIQAAKQEKIQQQQTAEKQLKELEEAIKSETEIFKGFKVNDGLKNKVFETMTEIVDYTKDVNGNQVPLNALMKHRVDNPIDFEKKLYYLYTLTNGFKDIEKFNVKATTVAARKLRDAVQNNTFIKLGGDTEYAKDPNEYSAPIVDV
jgi:hypothetical protein